MRKFIGAAAMLLLSSAAHAQSGTGGTPVKPQDEAMIVLSSDFRRLGEDLRDLLAKKEQELTAARGVADAAQRRVEQIEAYAKACGDKPGCFVPIAPATH